MTIVAGCLQEITHITERLPHETIEANINTSAEACDNQRRIETVHLMLCHIFSLGLLEK